MIAREWKCLCPPETAEGFLGHLRATGVDEAKTVPGFLGHQIFTRPRDGQVEFTLILYWESMAGARAFAGAASDEEAGRAVLYPGDERYRIVSETVVRHYEVVEAVLPG